MSNKKKRVLHFLLNFTHKKNSHEFSLKIFNNQIEQKKILRNYVKTFFHSIRFLINPCQQRKKNIHNETCFLVSPIFITQNQKTYVTFKHYKKKYSVY